MRSALLLACALALSASLPAVVALYEDQQGTYDWYRAYVGHISSASFHSLKPRLFVGSQQAGIVGALNLRDGSILWRTQLSLPGGKERAAHAPLDTLLEHKKAFLSLSANSLRAWDHTRGALMWELPLHAHSSPHLPSISLLPNAKAASVAVLASGQIQTLHVSDGIESSSTSVDVLGVPSGALTKVHAAAQSSIAGFAWAPGAAEVRSWWVSDGSAEPQQLMRSQQPLSAVSAIGPAGFAMLTADMQSICYSGFSSSSVTPLSCLPISSLSPAAVTSDARQQQPLQLTATAHGFGLASNSGSKPWVLLLKASANNGLQLLHAFGGASAVSESQEAPSGAHYVAVAYASEGADVTVAYVSARDGSVVGRDSSVPRGDLERLAPQSSVPALKACMLGSFQKKDNSDGFRALLIWADERISLVQQGMSVWARDEALAGVQAAMFTELPASKEAAADAAPAGSPEAKQAFAQFVQMQILSAKVQFHAAKPEEVQEYAELRGALSKRTAPTRDSRGFRKLIMLATESGKVAALHNGDGHIVWSRFFSPAKAPQRLFQWELFHDLMHAPRIAALHSSSSGSVLTVLNAHTGAALEETQLPGSVDKVVNIGTISPIEGVEQPVYLAVNLAGSSAASPRVHLMPDTPLTREFFVAQYRSLFFWTELAGSRTGPTTNEAPALQGYGFDTAAAQAALAGNPIHAIRTWSLAFPQPVLTLAARDPKEPAHTSVKVLGDRSIKYRYLNPNTMVVVTGTPSGVWVDPEAQDVVQAVIYIVDSASGLVLHHQLQPYSRGPAAAVITDNLAAVQLWDASAAKFALTSLDMYDATPREFNVLDALFNPNATQPFTSFNPPPLEVLSASFFTRVPARSFGVTRTRAGITSKQLLALSKNDQVYAIDPRFIDPRRPKKTKLSAEEIEERLMPYTDTLPMNPFAFVTFDKQVLGLRGTLATAARLESTSLIFTWGTDLQYTRVAPAKGFDTLDDDFNYGLLVTALLGLSSASILAHFYTKRTGLAAKWR